MSNRRAPIVRVKGQITRILSDNEDISPEILMRNQSIDKFGLAAALNKEIREDIIMIYDPVSYDEIDLEKGHSEE